MHSRSYLAAICLPFFAASLVESAPAGYSAVPLPSAPASYTSLQTPPVPTPVLTNTSFNPVYSRPTSSAQATSVADASSSVPLSNFVSKPAGYTTYPAKESVVPTTSVPLSNFVSKPAGYTTYPAEESAVPTTSVPLSNFATKPAGYTTYPAVPETTVQSYATTNSVPSMSTGGPVPTPAYSTLPMTTVQSYSTSAGAPATTTTHTKAHRCRA
ncbi:hypothetical protein GQ54DRAFT_296735 [Martensiomyces pterosporus]|nr:hypothetical protein GQ54DRAFT_296735 [Martensiomyces pterosporus]